MIKKISLFFFISVATVFTFFTAAAQIQPGNALFEHLTTENGLSSNGASCLFQDSRGFIWIGTSNGLNRYDGVEVVKYFHSNDGNSIAGNTINSIREDKLHNLWIATNEGVSYFEPGKNKFTNYLNTPAEIEKLKANLFNVGTDSDDNLWVTTSFYLSFFDKEKKQFIHYKIDNGETLPITRNYNVRSVFEDSKKRLWIPTTYGVKLFNRHTKQITSFHFPEKETALGQNLVVTVKETAHGKIVASTWGGGLLIFNENSKLFEQLIFFEEPKTGRNRINIIQDVLQARGKLYCASAEGLAVINEEDLTPGVCSKFTIYTHSDNNSKSMSGNITNALLMDKTGTLWVSAKGISKIDPLKQQFKNNFLFYNNQPLQISGISIFDNKIVLGAQDAFFLTDGQLKPFGLTPKIKSDFGQQVWDVHAGKTFIWLATTNGLIQTTKDGEFVKQYTHIKNNPATIAGERLWKVYEDSKGLVWMATVRKGVSVLDPVTGNIKNYFTQNNTVNSLFNRYVSAFFEDMQGNIWFTSAGTGLYCYNRAKDTFIVTKLIVESGAKLSGEPIIMKATAGGFLILACNNGLLEYAIETKKTVAFAYHTDMGNIHGAVGDAAGNYWIITASGLLQYNTKAKIFKRYTTQNGLPVNEDIELINPMPDGNIMLVGVGFVSNFNPGQLGNNKNIPPVYITQVLANSNDTLFNQNKNQLPYLSGIEFHFAALDFSNAAQNMYKYRLIGIDKTWSQPTSLRSVSFAQLPPGNYTFEVMGSNADAVWNEKPAVFMFSITRPFFKAWWFYALLALAAGTIIYLLYRYRLRKAIEMEKMRTRIATDLHDDIGATLSSISMYSDALKKQVKENMPHLEPVLHKMGESSREMVTGMSDIVWAINPDNDSGEKLIQRMDNYATDMCAVKNISLHFNCEEKLKQLVFPLEIRKNIYLIFKEAVNNAVKYSGAKNIHVKINHRQHELQMQVNDDGKGFDSHLIKKGNGLNNMALRANEMKARLQLTSQPDEGTMINLQVSM